MAPQVTAAPDITVAPPRRDLPPLGVRHLIRRARGLEAPGRGRFEEADVLVAFAFGAGRHGSIGAANRQLAAVVSRYPHLPVLAQHEIALALSAGGRLVVDVEAMARESHGLGPTAYVDTATVARAAATVVRAAGWTTVGVVAHPAHAGRCGATCEAAGLRAVIAPDTFWVGFDPGSRQWWTRRRRAWLLRELPAIAHQYLVGNLTPRR